MYVSNETNVCNLIEHMCEHHCDSETGTTGMCESCIIIGATWRSCVQVCGPWRVLWASATTKHMQPMIITQETTKIWGGSGALGI